MQALEERRQKFEQELQQRKKDLSEDQLNALMGDHEQQIALLERNMDAEKQRQISTLQDKIAQRKRMRAEALKSKHEAEMSKEVLKQEKERHDLKNEQVRIYFLCYLALGTYLIINVASGFC